MRTVRLMPDTTNHTGEAAESENTMTRRLLTIGALAAVIAVSPRQREAFAQEQPKGPRAATTGDAGRTYVPPRTPWGDPDLQGTYTNKYEHQTPFERPEGFEGRRVQD